MLLNVTGNKWNSSYIRHSEGISDIWSDADSEHSWSSQDTTILLEDAGMEVENSGKTVDDSGKGPADCSDKGTDLARNPIDNTLQDMDSENSGKDVARNHETHTQSCVSDSKDNMLSPPTDTTKDASVRFNDSKSDGELLDKMHIKKSVSFSEANEECIRPAQIKSPRVPIKSCLRQSDSSKKEVTVKEPRHCMKRTRSASCSAPLNTNTAAPSKPNERSTDEISSPFSGRSRSFSPGRKEVQGTSFHVRDIKAEVGARQRPSDRKQDSFMAKSGDGKSGMKDVSLCVV